MGKASAKRYNLDMTPPPTPIVLHADQEHDNLRTAVVLLLVFFFFVSYWLVNALLNLPIFGPVSDYAVSLSCVLGLVLALGITAVIENIFKRTWHSGRYLTLNEEGILAQFRHQEARRIRRDGYITQLNWAFNLKGYRRGGREKRLPTKWVCLACQLQQDDQRLIVYSYMPPAKAAVWLENDNAPHKFHHINLAGAFEASLSDRVKAPTRPEISNEMLTGKDGRYWLAERNRWLDGLELTHEDFATFMQFIARGES
ncbi:MAG: hypothetical protein GY803_18875 [Chloroflexi bacterium]|nr:hypothetical protein [Chloroflexota bacterium]